MKRLVVPALAVALTLAVSRAGADPQEAAQKDLAALKGTWRLTAVESAGSTMDQFDDGPRWVIKGNKVFYAGKELAALTVDGATTPKSMDLALDNPKRTYEGIYSLKEDTLKICVNRQTDGVKERPAGFDTKDKTGLRLLVFRRDKGDGMAGLRGFVGIRIKAGEDGMGVVIDAPLPGSPAEKAGLKKDDFLVKVGGREATGVKEVVEAVRELRPNSEVTFRVRRDGKERDITTKVGVMPFFYLD
jgi:uncharacterized protein (TIGR03067 family)